MHDAGGAGEDCAEAVEEGFVGVGGLEGFVVRFRVPVYSTKVD